MKLSALFRSMKSISLSIFLCSLIWATGCTIYALAQSSSDSETQAELSRVRDKVEKLQADQITFAMDIKPQLLVLESKINAMLWAMTGMLGVILSMGGRAIYDALTTKHHIHKTDTDKCQ